MGHSAMWRSCRAYAGAALVTGLLLLGTMPCRAQPRAVPDNGGTYNGTHHEPNPGVIQQQEQKEGVAPSPAQGQQNVGQLDQLNNNLLKEEQTHPPTVSSVPPVQGGPGGQVQ